MYTSLYTTAFIQLQNGHSPEKGGALYQREKYVYCRSSYANIDKADFFLDANVGEMSSNQKAASDTLLVKVMHLHLVNRSC